jgi:hypothetical protein
LMVVVKEEIWSSCSSRKRFKREVNILSSHDRWKPMEQVVFHRFSTDGEWMGMVYKLYNPFVIFGMVWDYQQVHQARLLVTIAMA